MIQEASFTWVHIIVWSSLLAFSSSALVALAWATKHAQFERLDELASSIFDPDELHKENEL